MGFETKVILRAILSIVQLSKTKEEIYERIVELANAEGVAVTKIENNEESGS